MSTSHTPSSFTATPATPYGQQIDLESELHNQNVALQRANQAVYVPSLSSSLYNGLVIETIIQPQPFPNLFESSEYKTTEHVPVASGLLFGNHTRTQLRGS